LSELKKQLGTLLDKGVSSYNQGDYQKAIESFEQGIKLEDTCAKCWSNLGAVLAKLQKYEKAVKCYQKAIALEPSYAGAYTNLGNALNRLGEYEQAIYFHLRAINLDATAANHYANCGSAYKNIGRFDRAQKMYEKAIKIEPHHVNAHFDLSTVLLQTGQYLQGWKAYEWRFKKEQMLGHIKQYDNLFSKPLYLKQELQGKTLLIHAEQGFGDSLMMIRYVHHLKEKGAKVILYLREGLEELFADIEGVDAVQTRGDKPLDFDYQLPLMSLASRFDVELQEVQKYYPYLQVEKKNLLAPTPKFKIGIVWDASATGESYQKKVFSLEQFAPLLQHQGIQLYSLQMGEGKELLKNEPFASNIIDLSSKINNFSDTASYIQELDLVISSDTSVAHLAGAMGKEVWVLLQKVPDWRWGVSGEKSLWYPSARLFWQYSLGDWNSVFQQLFKALTLKLHSSYAQKVIYAPDVFETNSMEEAKAIILTNEDSSTELRWEKETPYLTQKISEFLELSEQSVIIDFGCGIGRVSKALIEKVGCQVIGVDMSASMRSQALTYVDDERFSVLSPQELAHMSKEGLRVDGIISIWVLQHIPQPQKEINLLYHLLKKEGKIFILNNLRSALPTNKGWIDEGVEIKKLLEEQFNLEFMQSLPLEISTPKISQNSFMAGYIHKERD